MIYFTSDHHFFHRNALKFGTRGDHFGSVEEMNETLIRRWNEVVPPDGFVYHLGDLSFGTYDETIDVVSRLHGRIGLLEIPWHHDLYWLGEFRDAPMRSIEFYHKIDMLPPEAVLRAALRRIEYVNTIHLSHYPLLEWEGSFHGKSVNLHGHQHRGNSYVDGHIQHRKQGMRLNVNVEWWDWAPVHIDTVIELMYPDSVPVPQGLYSPI